jgi:transposase InsO family protein
MHKLGIAGVSRGKGKRPKSPSAEKKLLPDLVNREFVATRPNQLWVADFTYVATWSGWVYVAFVIDVYARVIVGWRVSRQMTTELVMDALEQALWSRRPKMPLIHHSDRGSQYLSIRYTERLAEQHIAASTGSTGDAYDNALAETINGLYKTEVIQRNGPWKGVNEVEYAPLKWVDWFNHRRLLEPLGYVPPVEYELAYYKQEEELATTA